jgi:ketosteroid isomerase-like protein
MTQQAEARRFAGAVFDLVDAMDAEGFGALFAPTGVFAFANWPEQTGPGAIAAVVAGFFGTIRALRHEVQEVWRMGETDICRLRVTYTRQDGGTLSLPCANIWRRGEDGRFDDYRIYIDLAPLFAPG